MEYTLFTPKPGFKYFADYSEDEDDFRVEVFHVDGESAPSEGPPTSGEEYLRRVRWEANRCPGIVVSDIDPKEFIQNRSQSYFVLPDPIASPPEGFAPSIEWEQIFLEDFIFLIEDLEKLHQVERENKSFAISLPSTRNEDNWYKICFGKRSEQEANLIENTTDRRYPPLLGIILQLDMLSVQQLIHYQTNWIEDEDNITKWSALWLFGLFARCPKPVNADVAFDIRRLLRIATKKRASLTDSKDELLPALNILITIAAKYYGQQESH